MSRFRPVLSLFWLACKRAKCCRDLRRLLHKRAYRVCFETESDDLRQYRASLPPSDPSIRYRIRTQVEAYEDMYIRRRLSLCYWSRKGYGAWIWAMKV
jgi:hypothetical protein